MQSGRVHDRVDMAFSVFDTDNSGSIDTNELTRLITAATGLNIQRAAFSAQEMMRKFDVNKDGSLSLEEFRYGVCEIRELIDVFWDA